ncbi:unnamed protein product [Debaryomyces tyrocola]|nr:unnamed protein product [Debaryomyces tyrocola]
MRKLNFIQKVIDNLIICGFKVLLEASLMVSCCYQGRSKLDKLFHLYDSLLDLNNNNLSKYFRSRTLVFYIAVCDKFIDYVSSIYVMSALYFLSIINIIQVFSCVEKAFATNYLKSMK